MHLGSVCLVEGRTDTPPTDSEPTEAVATSAPGPPWLSGCLAHLPEELMGNLLPSAFSSVWGQKPQRYTLSGLSFQLRKKGKWNCGERPDTVGSTLRKLHSEKKQTQAGNWASNQTWLTPPLTRLGYTGKGGGKGGGGKFCKRQSQHSSQGARVACVWWDTPEIPALGRGRRED